MFGWGKKKRLAKLLKDMAAGLDAPSALKVVPTKERSFVVVQAVASLMFDDQEEHACALVDAALELGVDDEEVLLAGEGAFIRCHKPDRSIELVQRALDRRPHSERLLVLLALRLTEAQRAEEALELIAVARSPSVDLQLERARALLALDRDEEALPILEAAIAHYDAEANRGIRGDATTFYHRSQRARELYDAAYALSHGPEAVIAARPNIKNLIQSGTNYRLLAESLMVGSMGPPERTSLEHPEETLARLGEKHSKADTVSTHALRGSALLRMGKLASARRCFELACEVGPKHFAGYRGLAAVHDFEEHDLFGRAAKLDPLPCPAAFSDIVPDFGALTDREQSIAIASIYPLRGSLTLLRERGARIRLLPIDVRTVDLPEWHADSGQRMDNDRRALDALGGVASHDHYLAAARAEELWDIASPDGFTFGHEFAHLALFAMRDPGPVVKLYERALNVPYVASTYQMQNEHEFFACAYQDYLRTRYRLPTFREPDDCGIWDALHALFSVLSRNDDWSSLAL